MTTAHGATIPEGWSPVGPPVVDNALAAVETALGSSGVVDNLVAYYSREGNYAGASFLELDPVSPWDLNSSDLLALTLLSVQAPPYSVRRLLEPSPERNRVLRLLSEDSLPLDADLATAGAETLEAMSALHEAIKACLSPVHVKVKNSWVTASKLCARKRADLFPVRDNVVCAYLGLGTSYQIDWQVFRAIIQEHDIRQGIDEIVDAATDRGAAIGHPNRRLRHLDAILWMHARP
jgi:hypothetical protein